MLINMLLRLQYCKNKLIVTPCGQIDRVCTHKYLSYSVIHIYIYICLGIISIFISVTIIIIVICTTYDCLL